MERPGGPPPHHLPHDPVEQARWLGGAGNDLARAWLRTEERGDAAMFRSMARRYQGMQRQSPEQLADVAMAARESFLAVSQAFALEGAQEGALRWRRFLSAEAANPLKPLPLPSAAPASADARADAENQSAGASGARAEAAVAAPSPHEVGAALAARLEEFSAALAEGAPRTALQALAIEVLYRTLGAQRALLCTRAADGWLRGCWVMGSDTEALQRVFAVRPPNAPDADGDVFTLLLGLRWDSWIEQPTAPRIPERLPAWYRPFLPSAVSFVVMPQNRGDGAVGLIYLDGPAVRADALGEPEQRLLRTLKQLQTGP